MATPVNSNSIQRVKVYRLNEDGQWEDRGTGYVTMDYMERSEELGLNVIDEDDNATLLEHRISTENLYKQQDDTIISWSDQELSAELALSFLETAGCTYVWNLISSMQQVLHFNALNGETFDNVISELEKLPDVNRSNLPLILKIVTKYGSADKIRLIDLMLKDDAFFQKLMAVFEACEIKNDVDGLHIMFNIVKEIISLNSSQILEIILGDQLLMKLIGCLEYNPDVPKSQQHRTFLREDVVFKEVIPFTNPLVLSKIHRTYRIRYLKDVVLKNALDDATSANLDLVINANNAAVVTLLKDDIQELFARLQSPSTSDESRNNLVFPASVISKIMVFM
ncbi:PREDICTED: serine/threonine-protein phosphatase 4 regulatory subunit 3 [Camelina sativa]|uniref:Serine/threonine-protein phosphatase 4 regulatory subunit 3 n=1 Tax=Camelina sativa TaxID=90675 RepID=A0ABM0UFT8_CAMSA|nr:PREDICTED: serine/threonine-protein phosphatase 4 regulatory subunit 3 [Camelina sativa]